MHSEAVEGLLTDRYDVKTAVPGIQTDFWGVYTDESEIVHTAVSGIRTAVLVVYAAIWKTYGCFG